MSGRRSETPAPFPPPTAPHDPYAAARHDMLEHDLRRRGVVMHSVLQAMRDIPRHLFVARHFSDRAYADEALPSLENQTISQPFMVGIMTQELALQPGLSVLEIGTGTGYQTAILARLAGPAVVSTIERVQALADFARRRLTDMDIRNVRYFVGDGSAGWPAEPNAKSNPRAPAFDRILITAGTPAVPPPLLDQLADGGILVAPVGDSDSQMLVRIVRHGTAFHETELLPCRFVPLLGTHAWNPAEYHRH